MKNGSSVTVPLTRGKYAVIDEEDAGRVLAHKWCALLSTRTAYAQRRLPRSEGGGIQLLHRFIAGAGAGEEVDHINGDGLDNRRSNLRIATRAQNQCNKKLPANNTSGYKGVYLCKQTGRWCAQIKHNGHRRKLGRFIDPMAAAMAYDRAALEAFGEFARPNIGGA